MPKKPTHVLNLLLVPNDPDRTLDGAAASAALARLRSDGVLEGWRAGPAAAGLIAGGFRRMMIDEPGAPRIYGNRQGGFYARCPACRGALVAPVVEALRRWRSGGDRSLRCPGCDATLALEGLDYRPRAAPARFAVELRDVQGLELEAGAERALAPLLGGGFQILGSRG